MQFISLKWKLSLALIVLSISLVDLYVLIAKQTSHFEKHRQGFRLPDEATLMVIKKAWPQKAVKAA